MSVFKNGECNIRTITYCKFVVQKVQYDFAFVTK